MPASVRAVNGFRLVYAVLAHHERAALSELVWLLKRLEPSCSILGYNGGGDAGLFDGLPADVVDGPPLKWGRLHPFHLSVMRHLMASGQDYDALVTLDSDMMPTRAGHGVWLSKLLDDRVYMATLYGPSTEWPQWTWGRRLRYQWQLWADLFQTPQPYRCYNPGQTFRKAAVEHIVRWPLWTEFDERVSRSPILATEEFVFPTILTRAFGQQLQDPATHSGCLMGLHNDDDVAHLLTHPDVHFVHKVRYDMDASDRRLIRAALSGQRPASPPVVRHARDVQGLRSGRKRVVGLFRDQLYRPPLLAGLRRLVRR